MMEFNLKDILEEDFEVEYEDELDDIIQEYAICGDTIETDDGDEITVWCYDDSIDQLFDDYGIEIGKELNVEKVFDYDDDYNPVGLEYGDYIRTFELIQDDNIYLVKTYCCYNGCSADEGFAIFAIELKEEE